MKKILTILLIVVSLQIFAQSYPVTGITISLPANPDANTANWVTGASMLTITAATRLVNGKVDNRLLESKILVTIKKSGAKICGTYTSGTAPLAGFNGVTKVWNGSNAVSLLGKDCILSPGDYELCVQFFGYSLAAASAPLSEEKCKTFSIKGNEQQIYQPPQIIKPSDGTAFSEADAKKPISFLWTPVVPRPNEPVTYRLKIWQLMQGQNAAQVIKFNQPLVTKDVDNLTQANISNLISGPCMPPYLCDFVWNVQALNREGKPIGGNNGTSVSTGFSMSSAGCGTNDARVEIVCGEIINGKQTYVVTITFNNFIPTSGGQQCFTVMNTITSSTGGVTGIASLPVTIPIGGSTPAVTFIYSPTISTATTANFSYKGIWNDGNSNTSNFSSNNIPLPNCPPICDCGTWGSLFVQNAAGTQRFECGKEIVGSCNKKFDFRSSYQCAPNNATCVAKTKWTVSKDGVITGTGSGLIGSFTPTANGVYTITLNADCNGKACPPCIYTIVVKDCKDTSCDCSKDMYVTAQSESGDKLKIRCGESLIYDYGITINLVPENICSPADCLSKWSMKVYDAQTGVLITSGSGTGNNTSLALTLNSPAGYRVVLTGNCNDKECSCEFWIRTRPVDPCTNETKTWSPLINGLNGPVLAIVEMGGELYAGGNFTTAGGVSVNNIAKWDGTNWSPLGSGLNYSVHALVVSGSNLYVGGYFTTAGGVSANRIAKWDGTSWSSLGTGITSPSGLGTHVFALAVNGSDIYVGGFFKHAGGVSARSIAKWNTTNSSWSPLGLGTADFVNAISVIGNDIYVGGSFTYIGGNVAANRIAKWNGTNWSPLGSGANNRVYTLAVMGSNLYVGGDFTAAGGVPSTSRIAKWDGTNWASLGTGVNNKVSALTVIGSELYAKGTFTTAGGTPANNIARWDGTSWFPIGSGFNLISYSIGSGGWSGSFANSLAGIGTDLYVGGSFTAVDGVSANNIAKYSCVDKPKSGKVDSEPEEGKSKSTKPVINRAYYSIKPEYSGEVISVTDTLFLQIENNYSSGSNQLTYTIRNLSTNKTLRLTKLDIKNNQGLIRIALPIQNSIIAKGESGILTLHDSKKYYYINFKITNDREK